MVTPITVAELLVKPLQKKRPDIADAYRSTLAHMPGIDAVAMDHRVGAMVAALRAQYRLPLPDMLQAATAMQYSEPVILTQDAEFKKIKEQRVLSLKDFR